jgi:thioredoxin-like negative regulator of GroEL
MGERASYSTYDLTRMEADAASAGGSERQAEQADAGRLRLVFFFSPTSGHCRRTEAQLAQTLQRRKSRAKFELVRVNVEERADLAERFRIEVVPTLVVIEGRRVVQRIVSPQTALELSRSLATWLG